MIMASRSNGNFVNDEDDIFTQGEYNHRGGEGRIKVDMDNAVDHSSEQKASSPRSKHSATEQRRRTKINERFRTLINLIPPSDQKRDKASLLLEVIEHIRLLQDKVQKYESSPYPPIIQDSTKLTPWRANQGYPSEVAALLPCVGVGPATAAEEPETSGVNPSSGHDQFIHDEELSDLSSIYSQKLLDRLTGSLEVAGMDLTKVNVSVKVKVRRSTEKCSTKDPLSSPPEKRPKPDLS